MAANESINSATVVFVYGNPIVQIYTTITYTEDGYTRQVVHNVPESLLNSIAATSQSLAIWNKNTVLIGFASGAFAAY